jgi:hypothetical protein
LYALQYKRNAPCISRKICAAFSSTFSNSLPTNFQIILITYSPIYFVDAFCSGLLQNCWTMCLELQSASFWGLSMFFMSNDYKYLSKSFQCFLRHFAIFIIFCALTSVKEQVTNVLTNTRENSKLMCLFISVSRLQSASRQVQLIKERNIYTSNFLWLTWVKICWLMLKSVEGHPVLDCLTLKIKTLRYSEPSVFTRRLRLFYHGTEYSVL